jgi:hypothetical protein
VLDALFDYFWQTSSDVEIIGSQVQRSPISAIGSIATRIDHSGHFRLSLNSGSTEDIAVGPVRAMNGSHPSRKSRPKSLYSRSEGNCSALLASAVGGSLYLRIDVRGHFFTISYPGHSILGLRLVLNLKS